MAHLNELTELMDRLLAEDGCPWDRAQDHASLRGHLLEESYEVLEAIDLKDYALLREELGDLLYQIVFHAALAEEAGAFTMADVVEAIVQKMTYRHPHVFGPEPLDPSDPKASWEMLKKEEDPKQKSIMSPVPHELPALIKAEKFIRKARAAGYQGPILDLFPGSSPLARRILEMLDIYGNGQAEVDLNAAMVEGLEHFQAMETKGVFSDKKD